MKRNNALSISAVCAAALACAACGSSSSSTPTPTPTPTGPTVSSVTGTTLSVTAATSGATIATTGTTGVAGSAATPFTVTFSGTMDQTTFSNPATCGGVAVDGGTVAPSTNTTVYTFTPPTTGLPPLTSCVLTFPATFKDTSANALTAATYTFTTGCSTNDAFGVDTVTGGCWSTMTLTPANVPAIASGVLSFTLTGSGGSAVEPPNTPAAYKTFANITSGLIATAKITTTATGNAGCILSVATNNTFASAASNAFVGTFGNTAGSWGSDPIAGFPTDLVGTTGDYFCLAVATNGSVTVGQATTAATCSPTTTATGVTIPTTGSAIIALTGLSGTATPETCTFDEFTVTNAAATAGVTATAPLYEY